jgi:PIN domain nuclease of toxin-antitoxin system
VSKVVLDASAVLAVFFAESGAESVAPVLYGAAISAVNFSEVLKKTVEKHGQLDVAQQFLTQQALKIVPFDREQAVTAASLFLHTASVGLSFADRACLTLGQVMGATVFTAERRMAETSLPIDVQLIRRRH